MPLPAIDGTVPVPGMPGATLTAGRNHTWPKLAEMFRNGPIHLVEDIETFGVGADAGPGRIKCVTVGTDREAVILNPREEYDRTLIRWAQDHALSLTFHNLPFDAPSLAINGLFPIELVDKCWDTLLDARLADPGTLPLKDLDSCLERFLGIESEPILKLFKSLGYKTKREGFLGLDIDSAAYLFGAASDVIGTARLAPVIHEAAIRRQLDHPFKPPIGLSRYEAEQMRAERHEHNRAGVEQTIRGMAVDFDYLHRFQQKNQARIQQTRAYLASLGITNANQLVQFLDSAGVLPRDYRRTKGGKLGTAADDLQALNHPLARMWAGVEGPDGKVLVQGLTQLEKLQGYLQKAVNEADSNGRIHPTTAVLKAAHGRDSMAGIEIHQFPEEARPVILFDEPGRSTDWSQQEPRVAMNLAGDIGAPLLDYERSGTKIYKGIATFADLIMDVAKVVVLAGLYGEGRAKLSNDLGLPPDPWVDEWTTGYGKVIKAHWDYQAAKDIQAAVFSAIPHVERYMNDGKRTARQHGLAWTMAGRIIPIPSSWFMGQFGVQAHKWINYNVSGSASDEYSSARVQLRRMGLGHLVWWGMHDELVHANSIAYEVKQVMETPSERFCRLAGRVPVIRTDSALMERHWMKV